MLSAAIVLILVTIFTLVILFNINFFIQKIVVAVFFVVGISASAIAFLCIQRKAVLCIVVVGIVCCLSSLAFSAPQLSTISQPHTSTTIVK
jgi:hypothetical protein